MFKFLAINDKVVPDKELIIKLYYDVINVSMTITTSFCSTQHISDGFIQVFVSPTVLFTVMQITNN